MLPPRVRSIIVSRLVSRQGGLASAHTVSDDEPPDILEDLIWRLVRSYDGASNPVKMSLDALDGVILR